MKRLLFFSASSFASCDNMSNEFNQMIKDEQIKNNFEIIRVNVSDDKEGFTEQFKITQLPAVVIEQNNQAQFKSEGGLINNTLLKIISLY